MGLMSLREGLEDQRRAWQRFHAWEAAEPPAERDPARIIADLGAILDWIPLATRLEDPDPQKLGVRKMVDALSRLGHMR